jgi:hypothetical protein
MKHQGDASVNPPTFEEWVEHCFHPGHFDPCREAEEAVRELSTLSMGAVDEEYGNEVSRMGTIPPIEQAAFMTRLFESPQLHMGTRSDHDLTRAIWFLFSMTESDHLHRAFAKDVPEAQRIRLIRSIGTLYTELFERVCNRHGECPEKELYDTLRLDGAVYMMWDLGFEGLVLQDPLIDHSIEVLRTALMSCASSSCHMSALHGLGHAIWHFENYTREQATADRLRPLIHDYLNARKRPEWLVEYAHQALTGVVL